MSRIEVLKTYKIYIGGSFPRTESGRYYPLKSNKKTIANMCLSSVKDFRNAVVAARNAQGSWSHKTAYNRSQILYRIAEVLEGRKTQFIAELELQRVSKKNAEIEVDLSIDRLIYYAGWCDKYVQMYSSVNPVSGSFFNFSVPEPVGVVAVFAPQKSGLLGLVTQIATIISGGNTCVVLASEPLALCAVTFAEVLATSDVSGGVVNILTGNQEELLSVFASHKDVNSILYCGDDAEKIRKIQDLAIENLKRVVIREDSNYFEDKHESPYLIFDFQETKTTWHPIEVIAGAGAGY
ncbi:MAG TPA: aldehyde dehydrogenase family protein [Flavobacterium sp.]|jgi:acyl-CoA reductase-like NAD-dependent aldehyde dehydrogenase|uniref:aldehyde dehydrogenase family protein n=1 Tax=Flavobacterium sp. TaxID=239 RepID=UPI002B8CB455|nr:aldehyde dehydrogenase family protein [Flavobacterium sp.]HPW97089.1 aldehyde dehydrogenase family protein [Flavobacterium sp.]HQA73472.1 aldehyde dehydrogenase family protein [Flavobacterium sp.]